MNAERGEKQKKTPEQKEAERKMLFYGIKSRLINKLSGTQKLLGLNNEQYGIYTARFAHALAVKEGADNKRNLHSGNYVTAEMMGLRGYTERAHRKVYVDELTASGLSGRVTALVEAYDPENGDYTASSIANTANFTSTLYLDAKEQRTSFAKDLKEKTEMIKNVFLKTLED